MHPAKIVSFFQQSPFTLHSPTLKQPIKQSSEFPFKPEKSKKFEMAKIFMMLSVVSLAVVLGNAAPQFFTFAQQPVALIAAAPAPPRVVVKAVPAPPAEPEDAYPQYSFSYKVDDAENADHKEHSETRDGDVVTGKYSLIEPDGTLRTVTYTADAVNGFRAVVDRTPPKITVQRILV